VKESLFELLWQVNVRVLLFLLE